jgi:hypothetical protein
MKGRVLIIVLLALVVTLLESYYRLTDPVNYLRPTEVLQRLDNGITDILTYTHPFIQDWVAVVGHSIHLVLRPFYGSFEYLYGVLVVEGGGKPTLDQDHTLSIPFILTWFTLAWIGGTYRTYNSVQKDARTTMSTSPPIPGNQNSVGVTQETKLKLLQAEARLARVRDENDDTQWGAFYDAAEARRLKTENKRLGKELDRVCALLKKEGVVGTGI